LLLWCGAAFGGTGAGNEFFHFVNPAFDFHVASPKTWPCQGCGKPEQLTTRTTGEPATVWLLTAPEKTTWLKISFINDFPAATAADLLKEITSQHPGVAWTEFNRGAFVGYTSSVLGDGANAATEYYLVARRQVIRIEWQKDAAFPNRAVQLDQVKSSIDRASRPPRIKSIRTEKQTPYKVGDTACYQIEVDDLKNGFKSTSLAELKIEGVLDHWSYKSIDWVADQSWFRVCFRVTSAFGPAGLRIKSLMIQEDDGDRAIACTAAAKTPDVLSCASSPVDLSSPQVESIRPAVASVDNPMPDREGPQIRGLAFDATNQTLTIDAEDPSGVFLAEIRGGPNGADEKTVIAYADQLASSGAVSLAALTDLGWNTITGIVIYDKNGLPTLLRIKKSRDGRMNSATRSNTYEVVPWGGAPTPSDIPVISFLQTGRAK